MRIAIAQMNTRAGDFDRTVGRLLECAEVAKNMGADLLMVGLPTLTGNLPPEVGSLGGYLLDLQYAMRRLDEELACPLLLPVSSDADDTYPELALLGAQGRDMRVGTCVPEPEGEAGEREAWRMDILGRRLAFAFVYDDLERLADSNEEFDAVCYLSCYGYGLDDVGSAMGASLEESRFREDARYLGCWFMGVAGVGGYGTDVFGGGSFVLNPAAELVALAPSFEDHIIVADLDFDGEWESAPSLPTAPFGKYAFLWDCAALGISDYLAKRDEKGCCLVLDGTLGSSVLAALAVHAVGPEAVVALVADDPEFPDGAGAAAARELAASLHIGCVESEVTIEAAGGDAQSYRDMVMGRLAAMARLKGVVPFEATDKTALALEEREGTLRLASLLPLGDVYRSDVLELALYRNTVSPVIPAHSFRAYTVPEVDGLAELALLPEMCVKYCDDVLLDIVEWERNLTEVCIRTGDEAVTCRIVSRFRDLEPQRRMEAPVLRLSSRSLSDARMPLNNAWRPRFWSGEERVDYERLVRANGMPEAQRAGFERLAREGLASGLDDLLDGLLEESADAGARDERAKDASEKVDPADVERALGSVFGLLQDLMQSGTLFPTDAGTKEGSEQQGWDFPFSDN